MAKKHKHPEHVNHERWLVSYADFVTLLFAFFVVMFAVSQVDSKAVGRFTVSAAVAFDFVLMPGKGSGVLSGGAKKKPLVKLSTPDSDQKKPSGPADKPKAQQTGGSEGRFGQERWRLEEALMRNLGEVAFDGVSVQDVKGELVVTLANHMIFESGDTRIQPEGYMALEIIAAEMRDRPVNLRIEGHTDDLPVEDRRFPTNWELSVARAIACLDFYVATGRLAPSRLSAAGYGSLRPIAPNTTPEGRAKNRRVQIVVVPDPNLEDETEVSIP